MLVLFQGSITVLCTEKWCVYGAVYAEDLGARVPDKTGNAKHVVLPPNLRVWRERFLSVD